MKRGERWLAGLVATAILARAAAVLVLQSHHVPRSTYEHGEIAASLVAGRGFSMHFLGADGPTSQQAPMYPLIVAAAYAVGGVDQPQALLILELGQALLGGLMVLGVFRLARWISPDRPAVAWWGAAVAAFHPTLVYAATHVQVALLAATLVVWTLVWATRLAETRRTRDAVGCGLLLAICALTDPILSLVGLGVLAALFLTNAATNRRPVWRLSAVVIVSAALGITPWVIRNAYIHGEFVPIKSTFGYAFWQGNCAISEGTDKVVRTSVENVMNDARQTGDLASYNQTIWKARHTAGYIDDIALTKEDRRWLGTLPEPERSRVLLRRAIDDIRRDPARYAGLCLRRFRAFWLFDETNPRSRVLVYRASHLALTGLALLGLATAGPGMRRRFIPLIATAAAISLFHALTIVSARFHIPIEPLMAVWAGVGMTWLMETIAILSPRRSEMTPGRLEHVRVIGRLG
ncbi:glycosyltransferase family 39 protein [Paludisphaera rhizosphaerae]|uniref:glycosyltransferase family 39 protein n=1 Tax=Paludisphaera rhizosphaerae TaxID=2711216 RepID=UPI0013EAA78D|nr:glycosyltransferase family 39 protein [Paludisphaera rhizosphaerae]